MIPSAARRVTSHAKNVVHVGEKFHEKVEKHVTSHPTDLLFELSSRS